MLLTIPCSQVFAATGVLDQKQETWGSGIQILSTEPVGQSFIPTLSPLGTVEVFVWTQNPGQGDDTITCRIRDSTIGGTILGTASQSLTDGFGGTGSGAGAWLRFDFSPPITVTPGSTYVIELDANVATFGWWFQNGGNPYPDGGMIMVGGSPSATVDSTFRTYLPPASASVGGVVSPVDKLAVLTPYLALIGLIAVVSAFYVIRRRRD